MKTQWISLVVLVGALSGSASAVNFSLGPTPIPGTPAPLDDILAPGPGLVYFGGSPFDVNGFSYGHAAGIPITGAAFSVDAGSLGIAGTAVGFESGGGGAPGEQSAGIYTTAFGGANGHLHDGDGLVFGVPSVGGPPALGLVETAGAPAVPFDDVDGIDLRPPGAPAGGPPLGMTIYWTPSVATAPGASDSIFVSAAGPGYAGAGALWAGPGMLGLGGFGADDIDALVILEDGVFGATPGDLVLFSLAAGSPSLGPLGFAPDDILAVAPGGAPGVFVPGVALGLAPGDDLNALDIIPEPGTAALLMGGMLMLFGSRRRRS